MKYKKTAGLGYFRTVKSHTCSQEEYINQINIVKTILNEKEFPQELIKELENPEKKLKQIRKLNGLLVQQCLTK